MCSIGLFPDFLSITHQLLMVVVKATWFVVLLYLALGLNWSVASKVSNGCLMICLLCYCVNLTTFSAVKPCFNNTIMILSSQASK